MSASRTWRLTIELDERSRSVLSARPLRQLQGLCVAEIDQGSSDARRRRSRPLAICGRTSGTSSSGRPRRTRPLVVIHIPSSPADCGTRTHLVKISGSPNAGRDASTASWASSCVARGRVQDGDAVELSDHERGRAGRDLVERRPARLAETLDHHDRSRASAEGRRSSGAPEARSASGKIAAAVSALTSARRMGIPNVCRATSRPTDGAMASDPGPQPIGHVAVGHRRPGHEVQGRHHLGHGEQQRVGHGGSPYPGGRRGAGSPTDRGRHRP